LPHFLNQPLAPLPVPLANDDDTEDVDPDDVMTMFLLPHPHIMFDILNKNKSPSVNMPTPKSLNDISCHNHHSGRCILS
jgi:hypothetical protein